MSDPSHIALLDADGTVQRVVYASPGERIYDALIRAGVRVPTTCRGSTICGLCRVDVQDDVSGIAPALRDELDLLATGGASDTERLACRLRFPEGRSRLALSIVLDPDEVGRR